MPDNHEKGSVLQPWVMCLTLMQQGVLLAAVRGPDGIMKDHPVKVLLRWYRRCILKDGLSGEIITDAYAEGGGSFAGPCPHGSHIEGYCGEYLRHVDELPHHFQLHLMHAAEIVGYKHPDEDLREFWQTFYSMIVKDAHLHGETEKEMDHRLGDNYEQWRSSEVVIARNPLEELPVEKETRGEQINVHGYVDSARDIEHLGAAWKMADGTWRCVANVRGALCLVEVTIHPKPNPDD